MNEVLLTYKYTQISAIFKNTKQQNFYFNLFLSLIPKLVFTLLQFPFIFTDTHVFLSLSICFLGLPSDSVVTLTHFRIKENTWLKAVWSLVQRDQIANIPWNIEKAREFPERLIDYAKAFYCVDHYKLWKILQVIPDLPPEKSVCRSKSNS